MRTHVICHFSPLHLFLPSHLGREKKCCLHPPNLSLSLSSKIILKSASTVQRRRRGAQKKKRAAAAAAAEHPNTPHVSRLQHLGFQSCHGGFSLVHLGTLLEGEGLVIHSFSFLEVLCKPTPSAGCDLRTQQEWMWSTSSAENLAAGLPVQNKLKHRASC